MIPVNHIDLFVQPVKVDVEKVAEVKLSDNINNWETELIEHINSDLPYLAKIPYEIQIKQKDKELGYALGSIVLKIEGIQAAIPIIIKKRKLQALDVLMEGEENATPLTEDTLMSLVQKKQSLGKLTDTKNTGLVDRVTAGASDESGHMPPNYGKYTFASVNNADPKAIKEYEDLLKEAAFIAGFKAKNLNGPQLSFKPRLVTKTGGIKKVAGHIIKEPKSILSLLEKTGSALVVDKNNELHKGLFIDNVRTLDGEKVAQKLFITDKAYAYQEKIAGRAGSFKVSGETDYSINDEVVFVINGVATEPVKIAMKANGEKLACVNHFGRRFNAYLTNVDSIVKTASGYLIPKKAAIIKLGKRIVARTSDEAILKTAQAKLGNKTYITCAPESYSFSNEKVGTFNNLPHLRMMTLMNGFYENGVELLEQAEKTGSAVISAIDMGVEKKAYKVPKVLSITDSVKLAANLADPDSVDAVLSLGFINEDNVADFVEMVPQFEEVVNHLAKILISVRLGMAGDQNVIKHAMKYLQRVIDNLKALR